MSWKDRLEEMWKARQSGQNDTGGMESEISSRDQRTTKTKVARERTNKQPADISTTAINPSQRDSGCQHLVFQSEHRVQLPDGSPEGSKVQLIVGVDFGTCHSKVVLGEQRVRYAVPLQEGNGIDRYTVPVRLVIGKNGVCRVGGAGSDDQIFDDLKIEFLRGNSSHENEVRMVAYLALLFRHSRGWLFKEKADTYRGTEFDWFVNIGLPTDNALSSELEETYRAVALAAWRLSGHDGEITIKKAKVAFELPTQTDIYEKDTNGFAYIHPDAVRAFPEFAAQVSSYVQSPRKSEDLHALIDIGGGTIDVTLFNVVSDKEEDTHRYPILARKVASLGTRFLVEERLSKIKSEKPWYLSPQGPVPDNEEFAKALGTNLDELRQVDTEFGKQVRESWSAEFRYTKTNRYPKSPAWDEGLPVFVSGGGALCEFYQEALSYLFPPQNKAWATRMEQLPLPEDLEVVDVDEASFGRLAVAYGLAFDADVIGEIVRPGNIEDDRAINNVGEQIREEHAVTKEMT